MKRSAINPIPPFFDRYINLAPDEDIITALEHYPTIETLVDRPALEQLGDRIYAEGKWQVKDILQHIIDNERIQAYRALRFSRKDASLLPGYNEQLFSSNANAINRGLDELLAEFAVVRRSTIFLFRSFTEEMQHHTGTCFNVSISVAALGFVIVGHQLHHCNIIKERYLPLLKFA